MKKEINLGDKVKGFSYNANDFIQNDLELKSENLFSYNISESDKKIFIEHSLYFIGKTGIITNINYIDNIVEVKFESLRLEAFDFTELVIYPLQLVMCNIIKSDVNEKIN